MYGRETLANEFVILDSGFCEKMKLDTFRPVFIVNLPGQKGIHADTICKTKIESLRRKPRAVEDRTIPF